MRDDFSDVTKRNIAGRAGYRCSNPTCGKLTSRPTPDDTSKSMSIGVAAHIVAASPGGPRADASLTTEQRKSPENGIWLCQTCAHIIDVAESAYPIVTLEAWKAYAEQLATREASASRDLIERLIEDIDSFHINISNFISAWQSNEPPFNFDDFSGSSEALVRYSRERVAAYNQQIMPLVTDIIARATTIFGSSPLIAESDYHTMAGPTNYISMRMLDEYLQKVKSNLVLR